MSPRKEWDPLALSGRKKSSDMPASLPVKKRNNVPKNAYITEESSRRRKKNEKNMTNDQCIYFLLSPVVRFEPKTWWKWSASSIWDKLVSWFFKLDSEYSFIFRSEADDMKGHNAFWLDIAARRNRQPLWLKMIDTLFMTWLRFVFIRPLTVVYTQKRYQYIT